MYSDILRLRRFSDKCTASNFALETVCLPAKCAGFAAGMRTTEFQLDPHWHLSPNASDTKVINK